MNKQIISSELHFQSKFVDVAGSKIHYLEAGEGDPIVFLHGIPASSYLWRNIMPTLSQYGRCIAPDLIGMGKSDKPAISYTVFDHIKYIEGFINALNLRKITFVLHGFSSIIGFNYIAHHAENTKGIAFYESYIGDFDDWKKLSLPVQQLLAIIQKQSTQNDLLEDKNLINKIFNSASLRRLSNQELDIYTQPFIHSQHRQPLIQFIKDFSFGSKTEVVQLISNYTKTLEKISVPKLLIYVVPGFITTIASVVWCKEHLSNLTLVDLGEGLHFVQEYNPQEFSKALVDWYLTAVCGPEDAQKFPRQAHENFRKVCEENDNLLK